MLTRFVAVIILMLCSSPAFAQYGYSRFDSTSITMLASGVDSTTGFTAADCSADANWFFYNGNDFPAGGYKILNTSEGNATVDCPLTLPRTLTGGQTVYVYFWGSGYDYGSTLTATLGGSTSGSVAANDRGATRYWTAAVTLTPVSTSAAMTITVTKVGVQNRFLLYGLYITTTPALTITSAGIVVPLTLPVVNDDTVVTGNYISNGSFEAGVDQTWSMGVNKLTELAATWQCSVSHSGSCSLAVPTDDASFAGGVATAPTSVTSRVYRLKTPNAKYTASAWFKFSTGSAFCSMHLVNAFVPPSGFDPQYTLDDAALVTTSWTKVSVSGYALKYPEMDYNLVVSCNNVTTAGAKFYMDDAMLEQSTSTTYANAANPVDCIATATHGGNVYFTTDTLEATLRCYNSSAGSVSKSLQYAIYDSRLLSLVASGTVSLSIAATTLETTTLPLTTGSKQGSFIARTWFDGENNSDRELSYAIVPDYALSSGIDTTSAMCTHASLPTWQLAGFQRLGIKYSRIFLPWDVTEPTEGVFSFIDSQMSDLIAAGITPIVSLNCCRNAIPAYGYSAGLPILGKFSAFVAGVVDHFKIPVKHWEIWNEPQHTPFTEDFYGQLLKTGVDAVEANDLDDTTIIGIAGEPPAYITGVIDAMDARYLPGWDWEDHIAVLSSHEYFAGTAPSSLTAIISTHGKPVWQTESGFWDRTSYLGWAGNFTAPGNALLPYSDGLRYYQSLTDTPSKMPLLLAQVLNSGQSVNCNYESYNEDSPDRSTATVVTGPSTLNYDGSTRPKMISYAVAGSFLDHSTPYDDKSPNANSYFLLFEQSDTTGIAMLASSDYASRQATLTGNHADYLLFDVWGNDITPASGTVIPYGRSPVYLKAVGISRATLGTRLAAGTIASRTDVTAPNVLIADGPYAAAVGDAVRFRWVGLDDLSLPNFGEAIQEIDVPVETANPDAMLYAYKFNNTSYSDWTQQTYLDVTIPSGASIFYVKAKDAVGNESTAASRTFQTFTVGGASSKRLNARVTP